MIIDRLIDLLGIAAALNLGLAIGYWLRKREAEHQ